MAQEYNIEKIRLVDQVFNGLSLDDIKYILSADLVVNQLKAHDNSPGPILGLFQEVGMLQTELVMLRGELSVLKADFVTALRALNTLSMPSVPQYSSELQSLKSKYGVY